MKFWLISLATGIALVASAAFGGVGFTPWLAAKGVVQAHSDERLDAGNWAAWEKKEDQQVRARLTQGDLDSMINMLLFGTSFTKQPRIRVEDIASASRSGALRARVDDLVAGIRNPGSHERLQFLLDLLRAQGVDTSPASPAAGVFIYKNLQRLLEERQSIAAKAAGAKRNPGSVLERSSLFSSRGVSLDTSILPDLAIGQTLLDLKTRGILREGAITRVGVVGPGLDFSDKNEESSYDYYPEQTVQPFAFYDSLLRLNLAKSGALALSVLDISARVISHLQQARKRASYTIQLPRDTNRPWPLALNDYWRAMGDRIGGAVTPIKPPAAFAGLGTRAVQIRPDVVLACQAVNLDIVVQRMPQEKFDIVIGTNIFIYYGKFRQALALENIGEMLKPGGLLLTNDKLPETPGGSMIQAGTTVVRYNEQDPSAVEAVGWYRRR